MKHKSRNQNQDNTARNIFFAMLFMALLCLIAYLALKPLTLNSYCNTIIDKSCTCPADPNEINRRNLLIVDTTDPLRVGKIADIEELLRTFASGPKGLIEWFQDGKKPDQTSVFLLSNVAPPDMQPVAVFCTQPPTISVFLGNKGKEIRELQAFHSAKVTSALNKFEGGVSASQSPIVETLAILTSNSSAWRAGGTLILASDLLQNTSKCGYFEQAQKIPSVDMLPAACLQDIRTLQEKIRPSTIYPGPSVVALCELPGKTRKEGLLAFWRAIFQEPLGFDVILSCDSKEIFARRKNFSESIK